MYSENLSLLSTLSQTSPISLRRTSTILGLSVSTTDRMYMLITSMKHDRKHDCFFKKSNAPKFCMSTDETCPSSDVRWSCTYKPLIVHQFWPACNDVDQARLSPFGVETGCAAIKFFQSWCGKLLQYLLQPANRLVSCRIVPWILFLVIWDDFLRCPTSLLLDDGWRLLVRTMIMILLLVSMLAQGRTVWK